MSEKAVAQMRRRMLKETEGYLSEKLAQCRGSSLRLRRELATQIVRMQLRPDYRLLSPMVQELSL